MSSASDRPSPSAQTPEPAIRVEGLEFRYREGPFRLQIDELSVDQGEGLAVVGPSGSGKTTLLHLMAGIIVPEAGRVAVNGTDLTKLPDTARRDFRISHIGLVFQEFELLEYLDVLDNILLPYRISPALGLGRDVQERAEGLAERVGVGDKLRRLSGRLSHGEKQRVAVCRALLTEPKLLLADEPTGNLDPSNKGRVLEILLECARESGATLITVTHDMSLVDRFDRVIDLSQYQTTSEAEMASTVGAEGATT